MAIAPSTELRRWYDHQPARWDEFQLRYRVELSASAASDQLQALRLAVTSGPVTLLTATRDETMSHAMVLRDMLMDGRPSS
jgi:uncharacterized protein YeaO (DUF488 family)